MDVVKDCEIRRGNYMPGPSTSANIVEKSSSFTTTLMPSGGVSSRFFNSFASCFITFGGRFSLVAYKRVETFKRRGAKTKQNFIDLKNQRKVPSLTYKRVRLLCLVAHTMVSKMNPKHI